MKISFKYLLIFLAAGTIAITSCGDDDSTEPTPDPPKNDTIPNDTIPTDTIPSTTQRFTAVANGDAVVFTKFSAKVDSISRPDNYLIINGSKISPDELININLPEKFKGTANYPQATDKRITYTKEGTQFSPISGKLIISRNDSVVSGTFNFIGTPLAGNDSLTVTDGEFYIKIK